MIKFLLINAIDTTSEVESRYPGIGPAYLISALRVHFGEHFFDFKIIDGGNEDIIKRQIADFSPNITGISAVTQNFNLAESCAAFLKKNNIPMIIGGVHISMLPESLPKEADVACLGEGEETIVELMELFVKEKSFPREKLKNIKGIAFWDDCYNFVMTPARPQISNLDMIARPARDLLKIKKHSYIFSSRGCSFRCVFCASSRFWNKVRLFSAPYVVKEITDLYEQHNVRLISFFDDLFIINLPRLEDITRLLKQKGLLGKIKFTGSCRANLVTDRVAKVLKELGVVSVGLGLESGNDRVLKYLKGSTASVEHNKNAVAILKKYGLGVNASFVIGSPDETEAEMMDTYNFIKKNPLDLVDIYVLTPMPGTPIWEYAKHRELVSNKMNWSKLNVNFGVDYKEAIILSELYGRDRLFLIYKKFQRLRLYKNAVNIWHTPFLADLPKFIIKESLKKISLLLKN